MRSVNSDVAYDFIRKRILGGDYPPGYSLMTNNLSTEIGVSRTPVRDALRQLEADGLVSIQARLGASVKTMDLKEFREMCGLRLALETHAAGLAAQYRTPDDLQELKLALDAMQRLTEKIIVSKQESVFLADLVREDVRFHIAIMAAARNDLMKKEILRLHLINRVVSGGPNVVEKNLESEQQKADRETRNARRKVVLASHVEIYNAILQSDVSGAKAAMENHIQDIVEENLRRMALDSSGLNNKVLTEEELAYMP